MSTNSDADESQFSRGEAHRWATALLSQLDGILSNAIAMNEELAQSLDAARKQRVAASIDSRLAAIALDELTRKSGIRGVAELKRNGIRTARDVRDAGYNTLESIRGVGPLSAERLLKLAAQSERLQPSDLSPPADPSKWSRFDFILAQALQAWSVVAPLLGFPNLSILQQLVELLKIVKRMTGWIFWTTSGKSKRTRVQSQYRIAYRNAHSPTLTAAIRELSEGIDKAASLLDVVVSDEDIISQWRRDSGRLYAILEQFVTERGRPEEQSILARGVTGSGLSEELLANIESIELDTSLLARQLRHYQEFGAKFIVTVGRSILGDDMGLGKTIEALAAIAHLQASVGVRHHIVVSPASLVDNWMREIAETTPSIKGLAFREPGAFEAYREWTAGGGILVVSYPSARRLADLKQPSRSVLVVDEAHYAKNPERQRSRAVEELSQEAAYIVLMSGTILENRAQEFIQLARIANPVEGSKLTRQFGDGRNAHLRPQEFRDSIASVYLRRNQEEVLKELPGIVATDELITTIGDGERRAYVAAIRSNNLMRARIALGAGSGSDSEKIQRLTEIARECRESERKLLIFSSFRATLDAATEAIGDNCRQYNGNTQRLERDRLEKWLKERDGFAALAIQIDTGGHGLNLQSASAVVLMEPQFKPSTEWQAIARAHRIGQTHVVVVHRLIAVESVETKLVESSGFKAMLFDELARRSSLADASNLSETLDEMDRRVNSRRLLADERQRLFGSSPAA